MKRKLCFFLLMLSAFIAKAQQDSGITKPHSVVFQSVRKEATFPGDIKGWNAYLQRNLRAELGAQYIKMKRKETEVRQVAIISFLVDSSGNISEVKCVNPNDVHPKLAEESIRVIKEGPKWIPAEINGKKVIYRQRQSIIWVVQKG